MNDDTATETPAVADDIEPMLDVPHLVGATGYDTINHAACMLEYVAELRSEYSGESPPCDREAEHVMYGCWLLDQTIVAVIRHGLAQTEREYRLRRTKD